MNLFVARLNSSTTTKDLQKLFSHYGLVSTVKVILDHITGQSKCYGFVEMPNTHEAHEALKELDETSFQENIISVRESQSTNGHSMPGRLTTQVRNTTAISRKSNNNEFNNSPHSTIKTLREGNGLRNFGYRGSGFRSFR
ncbi:MAG: RNA-binding protein [Mariniphaga sp.]|nr:RNA-binding protein [Mariniphaga sp.]